MLFLLGPLAGVRRRGIFAIRTSPHVRDVVEDIVIIIIDKLRVAGHCHAEDSYQRPGKTHREPGHSLRGE